MTAAGVSTRAKRWRDGLAMAASGADIVDIGGESSRPGAEPVSADEELARVIPVIESCVTKRGADLHRYLQSPRSPAQRWMPAPTSSMISARLRFDPAMTSLIAEKKCRLFSCICKERRAPCRPSRAIRTSCAK